MADMKNDPSSLYDEAFMKKREEMFGQNSENVDIDSGRSEEKDTFPSEEESTDVFEEKGGLFSKFRRSKSKKKAKKGDSGSEEDGYDIFELENLTDEAELSDNGGDPSRTTETDADGTVNTESLDDINALLESVGINPIGHDGQKEKEEAIKSFHAVKERIVREADEAEPDGQPETKPETATESDAGKEKTRYFSIGKKDGTQSVSQPEKAKEPVRTHDVPDGQLILEGYEDEEKPKTVSEEKVETALKETRRRLIDNFRVLKNSGGDEPILERGDGKPLDSIPDTVEVSNGEDIFDAVDRAGKKKKSPLQKIGEKNIFKTTQQKARKSKVKQQLLSASALSKKLKEDIGKISRDEKFLAGVTAVSLVLALLCSAYQPGGALGFLFGSGARVYTAVSLVLFAAGAVLARRFIKEAVETVSQFNLDGASCVLIMNVFVLLHTVAALITGMPDDGTGVIYVPVGLFALLVVCESRRVRFTAMNKAVCMLAKSGPLCGLQQVENTADAAALAHGIDDKGEPDILYDADAEMPKDFEALFAPSAKSQKFYSFCCVAVLAAGFLLSLLLSIQSKDAQFFATGLVGCICLCFPIMRELVLEYRRADINKEAASHGAAALSFESGINVGTANAVAVNAGEIFEGKISKFRLVPGGRMALSDAVVYAAATLKETDSLIKDAFDDFIKESGIKLPAAEDIQYEEKLGYACWVAGRRVLVGNREMLVQHSIDAPSEEEERNYAKNKSVMYVVVEGIIAATFIVTYPVLAQARVSIRPFAKTGLVLMVNCADPCLNESYISKRLGTEEAAIKLIGTKGAQIIRDYRSNKSIRQENGLLCQAKNKNILAVINAAYALYLSGRTATVLSWVAAAVNLVVLAVFTVLKVSSVVGCFTAIAMQVIWGAVMHYAGQRLHK